MDYPFYNLQHMNIWIVSATIPTQCSSYELCDSAFPISDHDIQQVFQVGVVGHVDVAGVLVLLLLVLLYDQWHPRTPGKVML